MSKDKMYIPIALSYGKYFGKLDKVIPFDSIHPNTEKVLEDCKNTMNDLISSNNDLKSASILGTIYFLCEEETANKLLEYRKEYRTRMDNAMDIFVRALSRERGNNKESLKISSDEAWKKYYSLYKSFENDFLNYIKENLSGNILPTVYVVFDYTNLETNNTKTGTLNKVSDGFIDLQEFTNGVNKLGYSIEHENEIVSIPSSPYKYLLETYSKQKSITRIGLVSHLKKEKCDSKKPMTYIPRNIEKKSK